MTIPATLRTFVALPLHNPALIQRLEAIQRRLQRECPPRAVKWVAVQDIHLTLFFLGDIVSSRQPDIEAALRAVSSLVRPFDFRVERLGGFPNVQRPSVLWVGMQEPTGQLALLHRAVNEALEHVGFEPDRRSFQPHLTLGRVRRQAARDEVAAISALLQATDAGLLGEDRAEELIFFQSVLTPQGAEYTPLARFPLRGN